MSKTVYGGLGFPTPSATEAGNLCRIARLPDDTAFLSVFMGALALLENPDNWQKIGDMTPEESAQAFVDIIYDMYQNNVCSIDVEPPFWDDGTDVETVAPFDDQPWYGELVETMSGMGAAEPTLDWVENLAIWAFAGFIAYAGAPLAAIAFIPFARKFVLTFKTGSAGAIVRIIFDGLHLADIDTYGVEDQIINFLVDVGVEPSGQELWVEHSGEHNESASPNINGDYTIQVVREKLTSDTMIPPNTRYDVDCNCVQTTFDDGDTWVDNPGADPRHSPTYAIPPVPDSRCAAAAGMVELTRQSVDQIQEDASVLGVANSILAILTVLTGGAGIIIDLIFAVVEALIAIGSLAIQEAFDDAAYERILGYFYCNIGDDGSVTPDDYTAILAAVEGESNIVVYDVLQLLLNMWGEVMLQNAGVKLADPEADCSSVECPCVNTLVYDFTISDGGFTNEANTWGQMHTDIGTYSVGVGWTTTDTTFYSASQRAMDIGLSFSEVNVIRVIIEFEITVANYDEILVQVVGSSGLVFAYDPINPDPPHSSGALTVYNSGAGGLGNHITIAACPGYSPPSGSFVLTKLTICYS